MTRRVLVWMLFCLVVSPWGCSSAPEPGLGQVEQTERVRKKMPRFLLKELKVEGVGLEPRQVRKQVRMRLAGFRLCYYNFL